MSANNINRVKRKYNRRQVHQRYKHFLDPDFKESIVSHTTAKRWISLSQLDKISDRIASRYCQRDGPMLSRDYVRPIDNAGDYVHEISQPISNSNCNISMGDSAESNVNNKNMELAVSCLKPYGRKIFFNKKSSNRNKQSKNETVQVNHNNINTCLEIFTKSADSIVSVAGDHIEILDNLRKNKNEDVLVTDSYNSTDSSDSKIELVHKNNVDKKADHDAEMNCNVNKDDTHNTSDASDISIDNRIMFEGSNITVHEIQTILMALSAKHRLTDIAVTDIGKLVKILSNNVDFHYASLFNIYNLSHYIQIPAYVIKYHFFCNVCEGEVLLTRYKLSFKSVKKICPKCQTGQSISNNIYSNYFTSIDIEYQFKNLLKSRRLREILLNHYKKRLSSKGTENSYMYDSTDGNLYKNLPLTEEYCTVSGNVNIDGAPIFNNSKVSMWPVTLRLNELCPVDAANNVIFCGFLLVKQEPSANLLNLYLKQVLNDNIANCNSKGTIYNDEMDQEKIKFKLFVLLVSVDSKARPVLQNRLQYNAYYGCSWCYAYGEHLNSIKYTYKFSDSKIRTALSHKQDVKKVEKLNAQNIHGVKGSCSFMDLPFFDPVWGFPVDLLHGVCLGVTRQLWDNWTQIGNRFYIKPSKQKLINARLLKFQLPSEIHRDCQPFAPKIKKKASEWLTWLLFLSIICVKDFLPDEGLEHLSILVKCIYVLSTNKICTEAMLDCQKELHLFVGQCEYIYGKSFMTFNVHSLLHISYSVKKSGPLWATSTFAAESFMYQLKQKKTSPKGVDKQIVKRLLKNNILKWKIVPQLPPNKISTAFVESVLYNKSLYADKRDETFLTNSEIKHSKEIYHRCVYYGRVYTSHKYSKQLKKNDSVVQLKDDTTIRISYFYKKNGKYFAKANIFSIKPLTIGRINIPHIWEVTELHVEQISFCVRDFSRKCIFLDVNPAEQYVALMPNNFDIQ